VEVLEGRSLPAVSAGPAAAAPVQGNDPQEPAVVSSLSDQESTAPAPGSQAQDPADSLRVLQVQRVGEGPGEGPPVQFVVQFNEPIRIEPLTFQAGGDVLPPVYVARPDAGLAYLPRLQSFDAATDTATFLMLNELAPGDYELHLAGSRAGAGITDLDGRPLAGNDPASGDYVLPFSVTSAGRPTRVQEDPDHGPRPQDLGLLAPFDLAAGVTVSGGFGSEAVDSYQLQVAQDGQLNLTLNDLTAASPLPAGIWLSVTDTATNQQLYLYPQGPSDSSGSQVTVPDQVVVLVALHPGTTYVLQVKSWASGAAYDLRIANAGATPEAPPPLPIGTGPAIRVRLQTAGGVSQPPALAPITASTPLVTVSSSVNSPSGSSANETASSAGTVSATSAGRSSEGPVPAAATNRPGPSPTTTAPSPGTSIPASVYVALGAGPVGGVVAQPGSAACPPRDVYERVFGQGPTRALSERLASLAILGQVGAMGGPESTEASAAQEFAGWWRTLQRLADASLRLAPAQAVLSSAPLLFDGPAPGANAEEEEDEAPIDAWDLLGCEETAVPEEVSVGDARTPPEGRGSAISALALGVLFAAGPGPEQGKRPRTPDVPRADLALLLSA
jgi:hypothetical protein